MSNYMSIYTSELALTMFFSHFTLGGCLSPLVFEIDKKQISETDINTYISGLGNVYGLIFDGKGNLFTTAS